MDGLLTAVRTVQIAPVETAKAVQVTVEGTASMVGQAFQSCTETVKAATEESMQQLAETTKNAKVALAPDFNTWPPGYCVLNTVVHDLGVQTYGTLLH